MTKTIYVISYKGLYERLEKRPLEEILERAKNNGRSEEYIQELERDIEKNKREFEMTHHLVCTTIKERDKKLSHFRRNPYMAVTVDEVQVTAP